MYSLGAYELQERKRKAEADRLKKTTSKNWKPAKRNRFLTNIYGKGLEGLSTASVVRRDAHIQNALQFPEETSMFGEPTVPVPSQRGKALQSGAYAIDARRLHQARSWVVAFLILSRFGPRRGHRRVTSTHTGQGRRLRVLERHGAL